MIPKPTSLGEAISTHIEGLSDKLMTFSYRTPTQSVCSADISIILDTNTTEKDFLEFLESFNNKNNPAGYPLFATSYEPMVSCDYIASDLSCTIDLRWLKVDKNKYVKLVLWYDNEWGYSARVADSIDLLRR